MSKIITPISYSRVPKLEFPELVNSVKTIVGKYDPAALHIDGMYNLLLEAMPQLSNLKVVYTKQPETAVLATQRKNRKNLLGAVLTQTNALSRSNVASLSADMELVLPFIEKYFSYITSDNTKTATERIKQMFVTLDANAELGTAVTALGLKVYLDELRTLQTSFDQTFSHRLEANSARQRMNTKQIKTNVSTALSDLVNAIELARKEYPELDYLTMANEINELFVGYQSQIKARATRNKNATMAVTMSPTTLATAI